MCFHTSKDKTIVLYSYTASGGFKTARGEQEKHAPGSRRRRRRRRQAPQHSVQRGKNDIRKMTLRQTVKRRDRDHVPVMRCTISTEEQYSGKMEHPLGEAPRKPEDGRRQPPVELGVQIRLLKQIWISVQKLPQVGPEGSKVTRITTDSKQRIDLVSPVF